MMAVVEPPDDWTDPYGCPPLQKSGTKTLLALNLQTPATPNALWPVIWKRASISWLLRRSHSDVETRPRSMALAQYWNVLT